MIKIDQKKGLETRKYRLNSETDNLEVEFISLKHKLKYNIKCINIGNEIEYEAENSIIGKFFFVVTVLITIFSFGMYFFGNAKNPGSYIFSAIIWGCLSLFCLIKTNKDDILITNGNNVVRLFRDKPNEEEVMEFVNQLILISNEKKKDFFVNFDLEENDFNGNINWLLNMKIIDKIKFEDLKAEYRIKKLL
jgi:hypothetical protein